MSTYQFLITVLSEKGKQIIRKQLIAQISHSQKWQNEYTGDM